MDKERNQFSYTLMGYALIGVALAALGGGIMLVARWMAANHMSQDEVAKWWAWMVCTPLVFYAVIRKHPRASRDRIFWRALAALFLVHLACFAAIFRAVAHWRVVWTPMTMPLEIALIITILGWTKDHFGGHSASRKRATRHASESD
jgi:cation transport ATPase